MRGKTVFLGLAATIFMLLSDGMAQPPMRWEATLENAQRAAGQSNRLVLITFWTESCVYCKRMEAEVLSQPSVAAEVMANYVPVKINADHFPATAKRYGVTHLPTTVVTTSQGQVLDSFRGRVELSDYVARLNRVAAETKQRGNPVFAQVPAAGMSSASPQPAPSQAPPPSLPNNRYGDLFRPEQAAASQASAQPSGIPPATINVQAAPNHAPLGANFAHPAPNNARLALNNTLPSPAIGPPASPLLPPNGGAQPYPPSQPPMKPAATAAPAASGEQLPPPTARQPADPAPATSSWQPPISNPPFGLDAYCPVSLSERQQWVGGDRRWGAIHRGRTYLFAGPEEQHRFLADPDRYAPVISGNDIVIAADQGQMVSGMREHGVYFGNRVYLFSSEATLERFARNPNLYTNQALEALRSGAYPERQLR